MCIEKWYYNVCVYGRYGGWYCFDYIVIVFEGFCDMVVDNFWDNK